MKPEFALLHCSDDSLRYALRITEVITSHWPRIRINNWLLITNTVTYIQRLSCAEYVGQAALA